MKIKWYTLSFLFLLSATGYSQNNWYLQNSGTNRELTDVCFVDQNNGWVSGWTGTILHTTDGGQTWNSQTAPPTNAYFSIFFTDAMNGWAVGYSGKIVHTSDGGQTWTDQVSPVNTDLYNVYFIDSQTGWIAGGDAGSFPSYIHRRVILYTNNGGASWTAQYDQSYESLLKSIYFLDQTHGYATGPDGILLKSSNGGFNWTEQVINSTYTFYDVFFLDNTTGYIVGEDLSLPHVSAVFKTTDGGSTWGQTTLGNDEILTGVYFPDELNGWAVGNDFGNGNIGIIYHTSDGGINWSYQSTPAIDALFGVYFINSTTGWAVGHLGTIIATENQVPVELTSFTAKADNDNVVLNWQTATETNNKGFEIERSQKSSPPAGEAGAKSQKEWKKIEFVGGHGTTTRENNYTYIDENLKTGNYLYRLVQIDFDGTRNETEAVNVEIINYLSDYKLKQNYPNPFNPATTIEYSIPEDGNVRIIVYSELGERVSTLVDEYQTTGSHRVNFNAASLGSGIYYYRMESGEYTETHKMILLR